MPHSAITAITLVRNLAEPVPPEHWPEGLRVSTFEPTHARAAHRILANAYARGGGEVAGFATWWGAVQRDCEYDPAAMFVAIDADRRVIAFAHCWESGHLKDIAVADEWRGKGVGTALILRAMRLFRMRGVPQVSLKVRSDNPAAERLYRSLGMVDA